MCVCRAPACAEKGTIEMCCEAQPAFVFCACVCACASVDAASISTSVFLPRMCVLASNGCGGGYLLKSRARKAAARKRRASSTSRFGQQFCSKELC